MQLPPAVVLLLSLVLAGCSTPVDSTAEPVAPCDVLICFVDPADYPDWDLPEGASVAYGLPEAWGVPAYTFAVPNGFATIVRDADGLALWKFNDEATRLALPGDLRSSSIHMIATGPELLLQFRTVGGVAGVIDATAMQVLDPNALSPRWNATMESGAIRSPAVTIPVESTHVHVTGDRFVELRDARLVLYDIRSGSPLGIDVPGSIVDVHTQSNELLVWTLEGKIYRVTGDTHQVRLVGEGSQPLFVAGEATYVLTEEGTGAVWVRHTEAGLQEIALLPDGYNNRFDLEGPAIVGIPRIDDRILESANPTPFPAVIYQYA